MNMDSFFDQVKQRKIGFSPMSSKKEDIMSGLEIQSVLENKKFFEAWSSARQLSNIRDLTDCYYYLFLRKVSKIPDSCPSNTRLNEKELCFLRCIAKKARDALGSVADLDMVKSINEHKEEIFSDTQTDCRFEYASVEFITDYISSFNFPSKDGLKYASLGYMTNSKVLIDRTRQIYGYLADHCPELIAYRHDDWDVITQKMTEAEMVLSEHGETGYFLRNCTV